VFWLFGMSSPEINQHQIDSPDGKYRAYSFVAQGGVTIDDTPQVSVVKKGLLTFRPYKTNVFRCTGSNNVSVEWISSDTLKVVTGCDPAPSHERILFQKYNFKDIKIVYEFKSNKTGEEKSH
jgi:hypothetical protein